MRAPEHGRSTRQLTTPKIRPSRCRRSDPSAHHDLASRTRRIVHGTTPRHQCGDRAPGAARSPACCDSGFQGLLRYRRLRARYDLVECDLRLAFPIAGAAPHARPSSTSASVMTVRFERGRSHRRDPPRHAAAGRLAQHQGALDLLPALLPQPEHEEQAPRFLKRSFKQGPLHLGLGRDLSKHPATTMLEPRHHQRLHAPMSTAILRS